VAATTLKAALATTMQFAASLYEELLNGKVAPITGVSTGDWSCAGARPGRSTYPALYHWRHQAKIAGLN